MKAKVFFIAFSFLVWCAKSTALAEPHYRVINGKPAASGAWPSVVSLSLVDGPPQDTHFCGGVLISPQHVLTAAHCVYDFVTTPQQIQVTAGRTKLSSNEGQVVLADGIAVYPAYSPEGATNDLAIIRLASAVNAPYIAPVGAGEEAYWQGGANASLVGWGFQDSFYPVRPDNLQEAEVPIVNDDDCETRLGIDFKRSSMICAGKLATSPTANDGTDACYGDSGGPLIVNTPGGPRIAGLVSWGLACGSEKYWGVYTRVAAYTDWISSLPGIAPYEKSAPYLSGRPEVNSKLVCNDAEWGGDPATSLVYEWHDMQEGLIKEGASKIYKLKKSDIGRNLKCAVRAANASGETYSESAETGTIFPNTKKLRLARGSKKLVKTLGMTCNSRKCDFLLSLKDRKAQHVNVIFVPAGSDSISTDATMSSKALTKDSWHFKLKRPRQKDYILYARLIFAERPSVLLELPLSL